MIANIEKLRARRKKLELTQEQLGREVSIAEEVICRYERRTHLPMRKNYNKLAKFFGWEEWR